MKVEWQKLEISTDLLNYVKHQKVYCFISQMLKDSKNMVPASEKLMTSVLSNGRY
jgi:hypothetical protein